MMRSSILAASIAGAVGLATPIFASGADKFIAPPLKSVQPIAIPQIRENVSAEQLISEQYGHDLTVYPAPPAPAAAPVVSVAKKGPALSVGDIAPDGHALTQAEVDHFNSKLKGAVAPVAPLVVPPNNSAGQQIPQPIVVPAVQPVVAPVVDAQGNIVPPDHSAGQKTPQPIVVPPVQPSVAPVVDAQGNIVPPDHSAGQKTPQPIAVPPVQPMVVPPTPAAQTPAAQQPAAQQPAAQQPAAQTPAAQKPSLASAVNTPKGDTGTYAQKLAVDNAAQIAANAKATNNNFRVQQNQIAQNGARIEALEQSTNSKFKDLDRRIDDNKKRSDGGIAGVAAMANIPMIADKSVTFGAGVGARGSEEAVAVGAKVRFSDNVAGSVGLATDTANGWTLGAGVGVGF